MWCYLIVWERVDHSVEIRTALYQRDWRIAITCENLFPFSPFQKSTITHYLATAVGSTDLMQFIR